ncbi:SemiSWEET transporter [Candidatus Omnitrophota bacterium]
MEKIHIGMIGMIAGACTTMSFVPQIIKIIKTRHARDISLLMYVVLTTGIFLWLVYGLLIEEAPIIMANGVAFILCLSVIIMKIAYRNK